MVRRRHSGFPLGTRWRPRPIPSGEPIRKFDQIIGFATQDIGAGEHVHVHNCGMREFARDYAVGQDVRPTAMVPEVERRSFPAFVRGNGKVGTRNFIGILSTVNCSASVSKFIAERFPADVLAQYPNVDGIVAITHGTGCGMADRGEGYATLQRTLWGFAAHPNFASILMIGLGCEVMQLSFMKEVYGIQSGPAFRTMTLQGEGGTRRTIEHAHAMIREMLPHANEFGRRPVSVGEISLALQCGGSDGYSGITANPALGHCADLLVRNGGTAILSETPEIYGAEHLLTRRAVSQRGRRQADRAYPLVGGILRAQRRRDEQQSVARQQGRRPHHHSREIARGRCQGRHHQPRRRLQVRRADHRRRASSTWTARATTRPRPRDRWHRAAT